MKKQKYKSLSFELYNLKKPILFSWKLTLFEASKSLLVINDHIYLGLLKSTAQESANLLEVLHTN